MNLLRYVAKFFNSHPHEEDDDTQRTHPQEDILFNSHPHEEDDVPGEQTRLYRSVFQLTSSRGG